MVDVYFDKVIYEGLSMSGIVVGIGDFVCGLVVVFGGVIFLMVFGVEVMMVCMLFDFVFVLGFMFIVCGVFSFIVCFFEVWIVKFVNYVLL